MTIEEKAKEYANGKCLLPLVNEVREILNDNTINHIEDVMPEDIYKFGIIEGFIAGLTVATRWIPVEESLPEKDTTVLVKYIFGMCNEIYYSVGQHNGNTWDLPSQLPYNVTEWRPIEFE